MHSTQADIRDKTYRLKEPLRLIGKHLDRNYAMPDMPDQMADLLRRLAEIEVPKKGQRSSK